MDHALSALFFTLSLFFGMLFLLETGRQVGVRRMAKDPEGARAGVGTVEARAALVGYPQCAALGR